MDLNSQKEALVEMAHYRMPFGKYKDRYLVDLPLPYLVWFSQKAFPEGKLGRYLETMLSIKDNGLEPIVRKLQKEFPKD